MTAEIDLSTLVLLSRQLRNPPDQQLLNRIQCEASDLQTEVIGRVEATAHEIENGEETIRERWNDLQFLQSSEISELVEGATSQANTHLDLCVQLGALREVVKSCQKKDVQLVQQYLGFAQNPRQTIQKLSEMKAEESDWRPWAWIAMAVLLARWLVSR